MKNTTTILFFIEKNRFNEAFNALLNSKDFSHRKNDIIQIKGWYNYVKDETIKGTITKEQEGLSINKIREALLYLIESESQEESPPREESNTNWISLLSKISANINIDGKVNSSSSTSSSSITNNNKTSVIRRANNVNSSTVREANHNENKNNSDDNLGGSGNIHIKVNPKTENKKNQG